MFKNLFKDLFIYTFVIPMIKAKFVSGEITYEQRCEMINKILSKEDEDEE